MSYILVAIALLISIATSSHAQTMTGGIMSQNPNDPEHMKKAWNALESVDGTISNDGEYHLIPIKVVKAQTQVVAGIRYMLEVIYGESTCKKTEVAATALLQEKCELKKGGNQALYEINIYEHPWENPKQEYSASKIHDITAGEQI
ncbi:hypothetical protein RB195_020600 [Necator americanus]|uniref:Cystatin domain-containing protein n=1 Tax=Necator americanus TaxID=51031 RepID=A0ABR1CL05_NECAM